jgi:hypothetical protein
MTVCNPRERRKPTLCQRGPRAGLVRSVRSDLGRHLDLRAIYRLVDAVAFARSVSTPLTAHVTIIWNRAPGFSQRRWASVQTRLLHRLRGWLARRKVPVAWAFVRENVRGRGPHTHLLLHVPPERWAAICPDLRAYLIQAGGFRIPRAVLITGDRRGTPGMVTHAQNVGLIRYLSKGIDPDIVLPMPGGAMWLTDLLGVVPERQAPVLGKRVGASETIGPRARAAAGWAETRDIAALLRILDHPQFAAPRLSPCARGLVRAAV